MNVNYITSKKLCMSCNSLEFAQIYNKETKIHVSTNKQLKFNQCLEVCHHCGLVRQEDNTSYSNSNLNKYYSLTYRTPVKIASIPKEDLRVKNAIKRLNFIKKIKPKGNLLEVGFGDGVFLKTASKHFNCTGLDPSVGYASVKDELISYNVKTETVTLEKFKTKNKFDIICFFLVLEHIKEPLNFIKLIKKFLKSDGMLVIEVPDIEKYNSFRSDSLLTHEHVFHYSISSLTKLLSKENLTLIKSENKNISYGFSLLAAYKIGKKASPTKSKGSFHALSIFQQLIDNLQQDNLKINGLLNSIVFKAKEHSHKIGIYGVGFMFIDAISKNLIDIKNIDFLYDDTKDKIGSHFHEKTIQPLSMINEGKPEIVLIFSEMFFKEMSSNVKNVYHQKNIKIIDICKLTKQN